MKKCPNCGADIEDNALFCKYCGSNVPNDNAQASENDIINDPGLPANARVLPNQSASQTPVNNASVEKTFSPLPFIGIGLVVLAFILCKVTPVAIILGVAGFVLSIIANKKRFKFRVFAIVGIPLAIIAIIVASVVSGVSGSSKSSSSSSSVSVETKASTATKSTTSTTTAPEKTTAETFSTEPTTTVAPTTTAEPTTEATTIETTADPLQSMTLGEINAIKSAQSYLRFTSFSKAGLYNQLTSEYGEGFTEDEAAVAISYLEESGQVNWYDEAVRSAQSYLSFSSFSKNGLYDQLTSEYGEGFTEDEAAYAITYIEEHNLVDWYAEAVEAAKSYLEFSSFSRDGLLNQLTSEYGEGFTYEEAEYALSQVGY